MIHHSSVFSKFYYAEPVTLSSQLIILINVQVDGTHLPMILIYHKTNFVIVLLNRLYFELSGIEDVDWEQIHLVY